MRTERRNARAEAIRDGTFRPAFFGGAVQQGQGDARDETLPDDSPPGWMLQQWEDWETKGNRPCGGDI